MKRDDHWRRKKNEDLEGKKWDGGKEKGENCIKNWGPDPGLNFSEDPGPDHLRLDSKLDTLNLVYYLNLFRYPDQAACWPGGYSWPCLKKAPRNLHGSGSDFFWKSRSAASYFGLKSLIYDSISCRYPDRPAFDLVAIVDPVSRGAQKLTPVLQVIYLCYSSSFAHFN